MKHLYKNENTRRLLLAFVTFSILMNTYITQVSSHGFNVVFSKERAVKFVGFKIKLLGQKILIHR